MMFLCHYFSNMYIELLFNEKSVEFAYEHPSNSVNNGMTEMELGKNMAEITFSLKLGL